MPNKYKNIRKQVWADKEFVKKLEQMKAKMILNGVPVGNLAEITKDMMESTTFKDVEKEVTEKDKQLMRLRIKLDRKVIQ